MSDVKNGSEIITALSNQLDLDYGFISRNVRDLSIAAQFGGMEQLQELYDLAYTNLKAQLQQDKPLALDPSLVLEAFSRLSGVMLATVETKRKAAETMLKARTLVDVPPALVDKGKYSEGLFEEGDAFDEDVSKASLSAEPGTGVYGKLVKSNSMADIVGGAIAAGAAEFSDKGNAARDATVKAVLSANSDPVTTV